MLEILAGRLQGGGRLLEDYYEASAALAAFFSGSPWDPEAYRRKTAEVTRRFDTARLRAMAEVVRPTSEAARQQLDRVVEGGGVFVTTGHQPGLLLGPLYTVYKALSAVRLAQALEPVLGRPVAPLFWVASDDHDWEEANQVHLLDLSNELRRLEIPGASGGRRPSMRLRRLGPGIEQVLEELRRLLPETEFTPALLEQVESAYRPGRTVAEAFMELFTSVLGPLDLLLVDGGDPVLKRQGAAVLARELEGAAEHEVRLTEQTARLEQWGYSGQVTILPSAANLFYEDEQARERLLREDGAWVLRRRGQRWSDRELRALLEAQPDRFSPNVVLRPILESYVFPTVAYVGGPAEVNYFAQLGCLFQAHGLEMPLVLPRCSVWLIEPKVRKVLEKFRLEVHDFRGPAHELAARLLREELPEGITWAVALLRQALLEGYERLVEESGSIDPTLAGPLQAARNASLVQLQESEKRIAQHFKKHSATGLGQLEKARSNLFPSGQPQERVLNVLHYLVRYGPDLLPAAAQALPIELGTAAPVWSGVQCPPVVEAGSARGGR
ncbi:MAG: bacillithiol biosynthesis cysteine-adding enzyme BshC [Gemmatimonadetes bacterium]|nr:bacillithiol biosynthesis cysteine-adding enzyme BshC [Gemmatimonadota bacterium]